MSARSRGLPPCGPAIRRRSPAPSNTETLLPVARIVAASSSSGMRRAGQSSTIVARGRNWLIRFRTRHRWRPRAGMRPKAPRRLNPPAANYPSLLSSSVHSLSSSGFSKCVDNCRSPRLAPLALKPPTWIVAGPARRACFSRNQNHRWVAGRHA
jgi:hypothetical protein